MFDIHPRIGRPLRSCAIAAVVAAAIISADTAAAQEAAGPGHLPALGPAEVVGPAAKVKKRLPYQKYVVANCPGTTSQCAVTVLTIKNKKRLEVTNVSCVSQVADPGAGADIWLINNRASGQTVYDFYQPTLTQDGSNVDNYAVNAQTLFVANAGDKLSIEISSQTNVSLLYCKVAGELVTFK